MKIFVRIGVWIFLVLHVQGCAPEHAHLELVSGGGWRLASVYASSAGDVSECAARCRREPACAALAVDAWEGACHFSAAPPEPGPRPDQPALNLFRKLCLADDDSNARGARCARDWSFEWLPGKRLDEGAEQLQELASSSGEACRAACLADPACRWAEFRGGRCRLSPRATPPLADDPDSQLARSLCAPEPRSFCSSRVVRGQRPARPFRLLPAASADECRRLCLEAPACRAAAFGRRRCALAPDAKDPRPDPNFELIEVGTCFDVSVECERSRMVARVRGSSPFRGRVYAKPRPLACFAEVHGRTDFALDIDLDPRRCGTRQEAEGKFSNVLVLQSNEHVVTATDQAIGLHCSFGVDNRTEAADLHIQTPSASERNRGSPSLPELSLHIVNMRGEEPDAVSLGELLRVQVRMSDEDTYGIFVRSLVARDGRGNSNLTLIDHSGCPVETRMMREVRRMEPRSKSLETFLEAFTFTGSSTLELEAQVETCLDACSPVLCRLPTGRMESEDSEMVKSYGRRRRATTNVLATSTLSRTLAVHLPATDRLVAHLPTSQQEMPSSVEPEQLCFDPGLFSLIAATFFLAEVCGLSACLAAAWRKPSRL